MPDPFVGEIRIFAGNFAPAGWALCNGQLIPIIQNTALFSLLGTTYGGNGTTTFALPDLRGRVPLHSGQGPGLSNRVRGQALGSEAHPLAVAEMPTHTHTLGASAGNGNSDAAAGRVMARSPSAIPQFDTSADTTLATSAVAASGGSQAHNNMQPYLAMNFIIALQGVFPPALMTDTTIIRRRHFLTRALGLLGGGAWLGSKGATREASAAIQADLPYLAEIRMFAGDFAPVGWAFCNGQLLSIAQYESLWSLIGTTYGGDGQVTFGLPDLRGRAPVHVGPVNQLAQNGGQEAVTLGDQQMPFHSHTMLGSAAVGDSNDPSGRVPARSASGAPHYSGGIDSAFSANAVTPSGSFTPHNNMMPSLCINFIICLEGVFPSQS